jgi:hypothetical protein
MNTTSNESVSTDTSSTLITAIEIEDEDQKMEFLPRHYGNYFQSFETNTYAIMQHMNNDYKGGTWKYMELSNGAGFMFLDSDEKCPISCTGNHFSADMSAEAASLVVATYNLAALFGTLAEERDNPIGKTPDQIEAISVLVTKFVNEYHKLLDYAKQLPEYDLIRGAID